jgi:hypothetical protein
MNVEWRGNLTLTWLDRPFSEDGPGQYILKKTLLVRSDEGKEIRVPAGERLQCGGRYNTVSNGDSESVVVEACEKDRVFVVEKIIPGDAYTFAYAKLTEKTPS